MRTFLTALGLLALTLSLPRASHASTDPCYYVTAPSMLAVDAEETVVVMATGLTEPATVWLHLELPSGGPQFAQKETHISNNGHEAVSVKVPYRALGAPDQRGRRYVKLVSTSSIPGQRTRREALILVGPSSELVFVQTDKPIYSPGQNVSIRVYTTDKNTNARGIPITLELWDPKGVVLFREASEPHTGVLEYSYTLPRVTLYGKWAVVVWYGYDLNAKTKKEKRTEIEVREYALPLFGVVIETDPAYILDSTTTITGTVTARYSYDQPVSGLAQLRVRVAKDDLLFHVKFTTVELNQGQATFLVSLADVKTFGEQFEFPQVVGSALQIDATVVEKASGAVGSATYGGPPFVRSPYVVDLSRTPAYFNPGLGFGVNVMVRNVNGVPAGGVPVRFIRNGKPINTFRTNAAGSVSTGYKSGSEDTSITVRVETDDPKLHHNHQALASLVSRPSSSRQQFVIRQRWNTNNGGNQGVVGEKARFEVLFDLPPAPPLIFFMVVGRGSILHRGVQPRPSYGSLPSIPLSVPVTYRMAPAARLVVWYHANGDVIANSRAFDVNNTCQNVTVTVAGTPSGSSHRPGDQTNLTLGGPPGGRVSLSAVDSAVKYITQERDLSLQQVFREVGGHDLACGPSGGADVNDVFSKSGIVVLTGNDTVGTRARENIGCDQFERPRHRTSHSGWAENNKTMDPPDCCLAGELLAGSELNTTNLDVLCRQNAVMAGMSVNCTNAFYRCCTRNIISGDSGDGRSSETHADKDVTLVERSSVHWYFPESWLFETVQLSKTTGAATLPVTFPHSITTWVVSAVATSPLEGICVGRPTEVKVAQPLFVRLDVPKHALVGEQLDIKATVFGNYISPWVSLSINCTESICIPETHGTVGDWCNQKRIGNLRTVTWPVVPAAAGRFPITVRLLAEGEAIQMSIQKYIEIRHGGIQRKRSLSVLLSPASLQLASPAENIATISWNVTAQKQFVDLDLQLPPEAIPRSLTGTITITGDAMEPLVTAVRTNEDSPAGNSPAYGPYVLADLARDLAVARYLEGSHQMTPDLRRQTAISLSRGIWEIVQFFQGDGGFALWKNGNSSLRLTARTMEVLAQVSRLDVANILTINPSYVMWYAAAWLFKRQHYDGHFRSTSDGAAQVEDSHLGRIAATTAALNALTEYGSKHQRIRRATIKASNYLANNIDNTASSWHLAAMSYSLAITNNAASHRALNILKSKAHCIYDISGVEAKSCHWPVEVDEPDWATRAEERNFWHRRDPGHVELETCSYALLTQLLLSDDHLQESVASWLLHQRHQALGLTNLKGLIVSVQALTTYSLLRLRTPVNIDFLLTTGRNSTQQLDASSSDDVTKLSSHTYDISQVKDGVLTVEATGSGVGFVQVEMLYRVYDNTAPSSNYNITVATSKPVMFRVPNFSFSRSREGGIFQDDDNIIDFKTCLHRVTGSTGSDGGLMLDVGLHTGYEPVEDSLLQTNHAFYEHHYVTTRSAIFFLKQVATSERVCLKFKVRKTAKVRNVKHASVKLYSTTGERLHETFYHAEKPDNAPISQCVKKVNECPICYGFGTDETQPEASTDVKKRISKYKYAFIINVKDETISGGVVRTRAVISRIIKHSGSDRPYLETGHERTFLSKIISQCPCPRFEKRKKYLIIGNKEYKNENNGYGYNYYIDDSTLVLERHIITHDPRIKSSIRQLWGSIKGSQNGL